jgi:V8-like Glu-specific endopeptidase
MRLKAMLPAVLHGAIVVAQVAPPPADEVALDRVLHSGIDPACLIEIPDAEWLRLHFSEPNLPGDPAGDGWMILVTSLADGATQTFTSETIAQWNSSSAYFNGRSVRVELVSRGNTLAASVRVVGATRGLPTSGLYAERSICGSTDDRILSNDPAVGRMMPAGCTTWLFNDGNRTLLSAGHCGVGADTVVQFNVPLSDSNGVVRHPPPSDQYAVEPSSIQQVSGGLGNDWAYYGCYPNTQTGLTPYQAQGQCLYLADTVPAPSGQFIRITGYGTVSTPVPREWNQVQKTHAGLYAVRSGSSLGYATDTTGGNSGSPIILDGTRVAWGIHTHGGCSSTGGNNWGTASTNTGLRNALANPRGICASGNAPASGAIILAGDLNNNVGLVSDTEGRFGAIAQFGATIQGLAFDALRERVLAVDSLGRLWSIDPRSVADAWIISTTSLAALTGLAHDPVHNSLFAIRGSDGQLFEIEIESGNALPIGMPAGTNVGGLEADPRSGALYAVRDDTTGTVLLRFDHPVGTWVVVGPLGAQATDCNALAYLPVGRLFTIDRPTARLLQIDPDTGAATVVGFTGGMFGAAYGMAGTSYRCQPEDFNQDGSLDGFDIETLEQIVSGAAEHPRADVNSDGSLDGFDIESYERMLAGECP